jgi:DNA processing protein
MTASGLRVAPREIDRMVAGLVVGDESTQDVFVAATMSMLCEPGDSVAGLLSDRIGQSAALEAIIDHSVGATELLSLLDIEIADRPIGLERALSDGLARWRKRLSLGALETALDKMRAVGGRVVSPSSLFWPAGFADLGVAAPLAIWLRGDPERLQWLDRSVAIVGSRVATSYGQYSVGELVEAAFERDYCVLSGGAYGIDSIAHNAALALGGKTVAVMAGGLDALYPSGNSPLLNRIEREGLIIAEVAPGVVPAKFRFLQRNRLIAAGSQATVVVEAGYRSGSINTAYHANTLERPAGAVPGLISAVSAQGCHRLIRDGRAQLIGSGNDMLELLGEPLEFTGSGGFGSSAAGSLGSLETRVLDATGFSATTFEQIVAESGLTVGETQLALGSLELSQLVERTSGLWRKR